MTIGVRESLKMLMIGSAMLIAAPAIAAAGQADGVSFRVTAGTLDNALTQIASQSGRQILFDPALVRGRTVNGIQGTMTPEAAVRQLLDGSGLTLRIDDNGRWLVVRYAAAAVPTDGKVLGTVRVTTGAEGIAHAGANGSSDVFATEGTKSYTTTAQGIATKQPLTLKETPQAVSVVTRQQLDDRTINSFSSVLDALPGITVSAGQPAGETTAIFSRGFELNNIQIDGGSPLSVGSTSTFTSNYSVIDDLSIYDSVQLQRGAAGQFTGVGSPGGVLSLTRKRPLDHAALDATVQLGSWSRARGVIDASSPVLLDGLIRARVVLTAERNDEFYNFADRRFWQAYTNFEIDPSPNTTINFGVKFSNNRSTPSRGLPTDKDGKLIDFPRDTCYCTDWSRSKINGEEFFGQLTQKVGSDWSVHLNGSANLQKLDSHLLIYSANKGGINPADPFSAFANVYDFKQRSDQYLLDGYIAGKTKVLGMGVDLTLGANFQSINQALQGDNDVAFYDFSTITALLPFDPTKFYDPAPSQFAPNGASTPLFRQRQYGVYGTLRISPTDWIHMTVGERYTRYSYGLVTRVDFGDGTFDDSIGKTHYKIWSPPNLGLVVDISKTLSAFASYANIFDRPNLFTADRKLVDPVTGFNTEAGLKAALYGGKLNLSGSLFYIRQINLPQFDYESSGASDPATGAACCYVSDGSRYQSKGVDLQLQGALTPRLNADLSYVFTDFEYSPGTLAQTNTQTRTQPRHLAKLWAAWTPPIAANRLQIGGGIHAETGITASQTIFAFVPGVGFQQQTFVTPRDGYMTADAMVKYRLTKGVNVQLNLTNIFDRTYYQTIRTGYGNYYGTPRSFLLTLRGTM